MGNKSWRSVIADPFTGKKFYLYLIIAFVVLLLVKAILKENDVILGGLLSTLILFVTVFLIGLPVALGKKEDKPVVVTGAPVAVAKAHTTLISRLPALSKKAQIAIFVVICLLIVVVLIFKNKQKNDEREISCLKEIEYRGASGTYAIYTGGDRHLFKTQDEAMNYCMRIIYTK